VTREQYFAGELHGQSWLQAYEATTKDTYTLLQHLLIGINPGRRHRLLGAVQRTRLQPR
jgi:hypothetical protein